MPKKDEIDRHLAGLGPAGRRAVRAIVGEDTFTDAGWNILRAIGVQTDRAEVFASHIREHGAMLVDRFGKPKLNPAVDAERKALDQIRLLLRELGLGDEDVEPRIPRIGKAS